MKLSLFFVLICNITTLFAQEFLPTLGYKSEWTLHDFSVVERARERASFRLNQDFPPIPKVSRGRASYQFDGQYLYMVETHPTVLRAIYGFSMMTPTGPQWFLRPPISLQGEFRFLGASDLHLVLQKKIRPDKSSKGKFLIQSFNLATESVITLLEEDFQPTLEGTGIVKEQVHTLFLTDGRILEVDPTFNNLKEVATRFWQDCSKRWVDHIESVEQNKRVPQPLVFQGRPFFTHDGDICIPITVRETNIWTRAMGDAMWADLSPEHRERAIKQGLWPMKSDEYIGSDYAFAVLRYRSETRKTTILPGEHYEWLVGRSPYVKQAYLKQALPTSLAFTDSLGVYEIGNRLSPSAPGKEEPTGPTFK
jgi:hypothetical protein